jgi:putative ABC transport system permease protein
MDGTFMFDIFVQDSRYALRQVRRTPGFSLTVILTLALGVGANTALFSLLNALVLRRLPVQAPERLVALSVTDQRGQPGRFFYLSTFTELRARQQVFETMSLYVGGGLLLTETRGGLSQGGVEAATPEYYALMGVRPFLGRFTSHADAPDVGEAAPVVVLGYRFWQRQFAGDRRAIGETMKIDGMPLTIIGVSPPEYKGLYVDSGSDFMVPMSVMRRLAGDPKRPVRARNAIGRLKPGVRLEQARAQISSIFPAIQAATAPAGLSPREREEMQSQRVALESMATGFSGLRTRYANPLFVLMGLTGLLLVIAVVNLTGLLLARAAARESQLAICLALGATRVRLVQQFVLESLLLSLLSGAAAMLMAWWVSRTLGAILWSSTQPLLMSTTPDGRVMGVMGAVVVSIGLILGVFPAFAASRSVGRTGLQPARMMSAGTGRWGKGLLVAQVAMSLVLLFGAGLFAGSLAKLRTLDLGFRTNGIVWGRAFATPGGYDHLDQAAYYPELVRRLSALPGVQSVALSKIFPAYFSFPVALESVGRTEQNDPALDAAGLRETVSPRFFETFGISFIEGRDFTWHDGTHTPPVAIINASLSRKLFPAGNAIGQRIRVGTDSARQALEIVGIVNDAVIGNLRMSAHLPVVFRPTLQEPRVALASDVSVHGSGDPNATAEAMRRIVASLGHEYFSRIQTVDEGIDGSLLQERLLAGLSSFCAGLAVLLVFIGLYGLLAYAVARRAREIGVRMALGASRVRVLRMIVGEGLLLALAGVAIGIPCALAGARMTRTLLFDVRPSDPVILGGAAAFLVLVGVIGGLVPARQASTVDPMVALRSE